MIKEMTEQQCEAMWQSNNLC